MAPHWFELAAWAALGLGFASALVIAADIVLLGNRQHMPIMNLVFPLSALYMGPVAVLRPTPLRLHNHVRSARRRTGQPAPPF